MKRWKGTQLGRAHRDSKRQTEQAEDRSLIALYRTRAQNDDGFIRYWSACLKGNNKGNYSSLSQGKACLYSHVVASFMMLVAYKKCSRVRSVELHAFPSMGGGGWGWSHCQA